MFGGIEGQIEGQKEQKVEVPEGLKKINTLSFDREVIKLLDQTKLPQEEVILEISNYEELGKAIKRLSVRGAPALGIVGAYGVYLGVKDLVGMDYKRFKDEATKVIKYLKGTRPTAVNLFWGISQVADIIAEGKAALEVVDKIYEQTKYLYKDDLKRSYMIGKHGTTLLGNGFKVITHCNAGGLATSGYGTALAVIYEGYGVGKVGHVYVDETRPLMQGSRLTTWELMKYGIPLTLITDNAACYTMKTKGINACIVGADRIALNGDVANKIGTYSLAVNAYHHGIPFYVAAPMSTFDKELEDGSLIPIEERSADEVRNVGNFPISPKGVSVYAPAFDVTPNKYITAIITELGVIKPAYKANIAKALQNLII